MKTLLFVLTLSMTSAIAGEAAKKSRTPQECDSCVLGTGYCQDGAPRLTCFVDSMGKCPGAQNLKGISFALFKKPKDTGCTCSGTGIVEMKCVMR